MANLESTLRKLSNENTAKTFAFNASEAEKSRQFSKEMSDTSHQREVEDLKRAGLNPVLSANSGASAYSASSASGQADNSAIGLLASIYQTKLNNANAVKIANMQKNKDIEIARIQAQAQKYQSDNAFAASRYNTDISSNTSLTNSARQYNATDYGAIEYLGLPKNITKALKGAYVGTKALGNIVKVFNLKRGRK